MELVHGLTARLLVQAVNILGDNCCKLSRRLKLGKLSMCRIGLGIQTKHPLFIKPVKFLRMSQKKRCG